MQASGGVAIQPGLGQQNLVQQSGDPVFIKSRNYTKEQVAVSIDGQSHRLLFASGRLVQAQHETLERFDVRTKSMLLSEGPNGQPRVLWQDIITSEVDNRLSFDPIVAAEPNSNHLFHGYRESLGEFHPIDDSVSEALRVRAFKHHERHKTAVVLELGGLSPEEFKTVVDDISDETLSRTTP